MLITALNKEKRDYYNRGKLEGKSEDKHAIAIKMLVKGFDLELIAELTGLVNEEITPLKRELENANNV